jgi:hypothetical protein
MTETTGGADSLVVADADDEGDETVPLAAAGAGIVPTPIAEIAGTSVAVVSAEDKEVNVGVS